MAKIITEAQREEARFRVAAYVKLRQNQTNKKTAGLRKIAAEMPQEMAKALTEMGSLFTDLATILTGLAGDTDALKSNLDLDAMPKTASIRERVAARRKYARTFRTLANDAPGEIGAALSEVYGLLDDAAEGIETMAKNFGLPLDTEESERVESNEEMFDAASPESTPADPVEPAPKVAADSKDEWSTEPFPGGDEGRPGPKPTK
jgi:hypothetical protein